MKLEDEIREVQNIIDQCKQQEKEKDLEIKNNKSSIEIEENKFHTSKREYDKHNENKG
jgi:hypothetical protein